MTDPLAFLAAAHKAAQRDAEAATPGPWIVRNLGRHDQSAILRDTGERTPLGLPIGPALASTLGSHGAADARHIAHHDPAAVLRQIAAERKILKLHSGAHECSSYNEMTRDIDSYHYVLESEHCTTVWAIAEAYGCPDVPKCGATTVFWPEAEACDAECMLTVAHDGDHEDEVLGTWEPEQP